MLASMACAALPSSRSPISLAAIMSPASALLTTCSAMRSRRWLFSTRFRTAWRSASRHSPAEAGVELSSSDTPLDLVERQGERLIQIVPIDRTRLFQLKQDLMCQHQARRDHELAAGERCFLGQAQVEGYRHLPAAAHDLLGEQLSCRRLRNVEQLHLQFDAPR